MKGWNWTDRDKWLEKRVETVTGDHIMRVYQSGGTEWSYLYFHNKQFRAGGKADTQEGAMKTAEIMIV